MNDTADHLTLETLLQDWLGESDAATREAVDAHLMACDACGAELDGLLALRDAVRGAVRAGAVNFTAAPAFVERMAAEGVRIREYRLAPGGSVNCTVAPDDQMLVGRLQAPLQGVQRLDMTSETSNEPGVVQIAEDLPFDPAAGEVLLLASVAEVRQLPAHTMQLTLLAHEAGGGRRELGRYVFHHSPWAGPPGKA